MEVNAENCGELEITVDITFDWQNGVNQNWVHGVSFSGSAGWTGNAGVPPGPNWLALNTITGCCSNNTYGEGYYYEDPAGGTDGCCGTADPANPADNYGADNDPGLYTFELTYCASSNQDQANENIVFNITEDGESGDWSNSDGCNYEFTFPININSAGLQLPDETGPICSGECITLDAGDLFCYSI